MDVDAVLLDIDGVLVDDWQPLEGAVDALHRVRDAGYPIALLTNTTTKSRRDIATTLRGSGFDVASESITTAAVATGRHLAAHHADARCLVLNDGDVDEDLGDVALVEEDADVVVVGSPGVGTFTWERCNAALSSLLDGAALVGMHRSLRWRSAGRWRLDGGSYLRALEEASGQQATVLGKPSPAVFEQVCDRLGVAPGRAVMVGDSVEGDVLAAQTVGLTGVLVRTGGYREEDVDRAPGRADHVIDSIVDLAALLDS